MAEQAKRGRPRKTTEELQGTPAKARRGMVAKTSRGLSGVVQLVDRSESVVYLGDGKEGCQRYDKVALAWLVELDGRPVYWSDELRWGVKPATELEPQRKPRPTTPGTSKRARKKQRLKHRDRQRKERAAQLWKEAQQPQPRPSVKPGDIVATRGGERAFVEDVCGDTVLLHFFGDFGCRKGQAKSSELTPIPHHVPTP